jgi:hypothetical protein
MQTQRAKALGPDFAPKAHRDDQSNHLSRRQWLLGGGAIAFATLGGVLAYAASSSESDVRDLYAGLAGQTPTFDGATRKRYDDLVAQGERYQHLSWAAFGLAGAAAVGVTVLFLVGRDDEPAHPPPVTPVVGPRSAGVSVRF